ncbi:hypothetical protein BTR23_03965 [Alkalihalophilus pseudofirmus]|nr:hypothetical protein BTR23_03965 [Alkalihalophilus pseudofirmus]
MPEFKEEEKKVVERVRKIVGRNIAARRKSLGLNSDDIAHDAHLNRSHYSEIEQGKLLPNYYILLKIASVLNFTLDDLYDGAKEEVQQFLIKIHTDDE